jgi:hypothetical protein
MRRPLLAFALLIAAFCCQGQAPGDDPQTKQGVFDALAHNQAAFRLASHVHDKCDFLSSSDVELIDLISIRNGFELAVHSLNKSGLDLLKTIDARAGKTAEAGECSDEVRDSLKVITGQALELLKLYLDDLEINQQLISRYVYAAEQNQRCRYFDPGLTTVFEQQIDAREEDLVAAQHNEADGKALRAALDLQIGNLRKSIAQGGASECNEQDQDRVSTTGLFAMDMLTATGEPANH